MKIVFFCGSLEPGKDGVGDYTRRLAGEMVRQGHQAGIIALKDQHLSTVLNSVQESEGVFVPVLRLPAGLLSSLRFQHANLWIKDFNPEWLSLQFVPFAYHHKGLVFNIGKMLVRLGNGRRWHIMVHELWVGMDKESPKKFIFLGWVQKQLLKHLFKKLAPEVIHTQTNLYVKLLEKIDFAPQHLPLFGNISVKYNAGEPHGHDINGNDLGKIISIVIFGGIHHGAPVGQLAKELKVYSINRGLKVELKIIGRCGIEQLYWEQQWKAADLPVELLGEQSPDKISQVLSNSTFGISTTPASLIEKSGSVAAMREHGLPVLCISRPWHPRGMKEPKLPAGIVKYTPGEMAVFITDNLKPSPINNISTITNRFVNNLLSPSKYGES